jgi:hypothetical protein
MLMKLRVAQKYAPNFLPPMIILTHMSGQVGVPESLDKPQDLGHIPCKSQNIHKKVKNMEHLGMSVLWAAM